MSTVPPTLGAPAAGCCDGFARPNGQMLLNSLSRKLITPVDVARNIVVKLGFRPYEIHLVHTRYVAGGNGVGQEIVIGDDVLLPIPLVQSLDGLTEIVTPGGLNEQGTVRVSEISGRYTEQLLMGWDANGNPPAKDVRFYWELLWPELGSIQDRGERRRFFPQSAPTYEADNVQYTIVLTRAWADRSSNGQPSP